MLRGTKRLVDIFSSLKRSEVCGVERALVPIWGSTGLGSLLRGYGTKFWGEEYVSLNNLSNPGGRKPKKRVGRGTGSGLGKTCGRGHKGQKARTGSCPRQGFEGGQTPISKRFPKKGFRNPNHVDWVGLNLSRLNQYIGYGKLDSSQTITMKELRDSGAVGKKIKHGVKVLSKGCEGFKTSVHIEVSKCSKSAREAIENAGGSVKLVYYNSLGLRALLKPAAFVKKKRLIPRPVRWIPTKHQGAYDEVGKIPGSGTMPKELQSASAP